MVQDSDPLQNLTECLCDDEKMPLLFYPCFKITSRKVEFHYTALPHYKTFVRKREEKVKERMTTKEQLKTELKLKLKLISEIPEIPEQNREFLKGDNQPIPIKNEHEFAHLYLEEAYSHLAGCDILELNMDANFIILSNASCFGEDLRQQASIVREERNKWLCSIMDQWTKDKTSEVLTAIMRLAQMIPGGQQSLKSLGVKFTGIVFHSNVQTYRSCIKDGLHEKVQFKIEKLQSDQRREIYVERSFRETSTGKTTTAVKDLLLPNRIVLLKGEAGAGKSSVVSKLIQRWAEREEAEDISCILFLTAGSEERVSLQRIIWDGNRDLVNWKEEDFHEVYVCLKDLAIEAKIAVLIDGLDEIGNMTSKDVSNASTASANPHMEVDIKTACAGILTQKIFPGARVLATGRTTNLINEQLFKGGALLYDLVSFNEADREVMVEMMLEDTSERERVEQELQRISTKSNEVFFKSPLMLKNIIQLIIERKVDVKDLKCPSEVYLMLAMKNLDFQKDEFTSFLELDPPEDQDYLMMCMVICQQKIQESGEGESINTIEGIQRNVKEKGLCFEKTVFNKRLQIPIDFIKKLGFFDIRKEESKVFLDIVHLSYMEFCCAGSLCREGVNIEEELSKMKDADRYEAITTYMAGLFSQNPSIQFLNTVKHVAQNFLLLLGNDQRETCIQTVFRSILRRSDVKGSKDVAIKLSIPEEGEFTLEGSRHTQLLVEALKASSDRIIPQPAFKEIHIADAKDKAVVEIVTQVIQLQLLSIPIFQSWTIEKFNIGTLQIQVLKFEKDEVSEPTIGCWTASSDCKTSLSAFLECLSCHGFKEMKMEKVGCTRQGPRLT